MEIHREPGEIALHSGPIHNIAFGGPYLPSARKLTPRQSPSRMCSRWVQLTMLMLPEQILQPEGRLCRDCQFLPSSWTRRTRCPAFPNAMLFLHYRCIAEQPINSFANGFCVVVEKQQHCSSISLAPECAW